MAEHNANPEDNYPGRYVKVPGQCGCETLSHYITLDWGPVTIKPLAPPRSDQLERNKQVPTEPCTFSNLPLKLASPPAPVQVASLPAEIAGPPAAPPALVASMPAQTASLPALVASLPAQIASQLTLAGDPSPASAPGPHHLYNARPKPLVNPFSVFKPAPEHQPRRSSTRRWLDHTLDGPLLLTSPWAPPTPAPLPPPPAHRSTSPSAEPRRRLRSSAPKRKRNKTIRNATKLTKQHYAHEEDGLPTGPAADAREGASAGLVAAVPAPAAAVPAAPYGDAVSARATDQVARALIDSDNARLAAAIRAQLATPVPVARPRCLSGGGDDMWRPRHQPKTLAGARLAAALAERRRAKLLIGLKHLSSE